MKNLFHWIDAKASLISIIFLFWALFWLLNGGDKFMNGQYTSNVAEWSTKAVLVDDTGDVAYTMHPMQTIGWFGVNRDAKMVNYFSGIYMPKEVALTFLYGIGVAELVLGVMFVALLGWGALSPNRRPRWTLFADRTFHRLALKGSILIFVMFCAGDILFGDRTELWEHSTFMVLCLVTYEVWRRRDQTSQPIEEGVVMEVQFDPHHAVSVN